MKDTHQDLEYGGHVEERVERVERLITSTSRMSSAEAQYVNQDCIVFFHYIRIRTDIIIDTFRKARPKHRSSATRVETALSIEKAKGIYTHTPHSYTHSL